MIKEAQDKVDMIAAKYENFYWAPHEILARITEETGELARIVNHLFGPKKKKSTEAEQNLGEEIADIIFALFCLANSQKINLDESFNKIIEKFHVRDEKRQNMVEKK
jgi:NTP pyrophosphatase (non-canonical NTP hydrolase)